MFLKTRLRTLLFILACSLASSTPATAQSSASSDAAASPTQARGVSGNSAFEFGDLGTVNLMNGNLSFRIPLGISYPVGPELSYQFALQYNSGTWGYETDFCNVLEDPDDPTSGSLANQKLSVPIPDPLSNAGLGWTLSFGRLLQPADDPVDGVTPLRPGRWTYVASDGARHSFGSELRPGVGPGEAGYSHDGSYLRLRDTCQSSFEDINCGRKDVDLPNGTVHIFTNLGTTVNPDWRLAEIQDPFGNSIYITYQGDEWLVTDTFSRSHVVRFSDASYSRVTEVELQAHSSTSGTATYTLDYLPSPENSVERHKHSSLLLQAHCTDPLLTELPNTSPTLEVDLLKDLTREDGSFFEMTYHTEDQDGISKSAAIHTLRIPTGASYEWKYGIYDFKHLPPPGGFVHGFRPSRFGASVNWGVREKRRFVSTGSGEVELGTWKYEPFFQQRSDNGDISFCSWGSKVTDPDNNLTESYFNTVAIGDQELRALSNASFTLCDPEGPLNGPLDSEPPYLSQRMFEGGNLVRSIYLEYEGDGINAHPFEKDLRIIHRQTVFHDDVGAGGVPYETNETYSNFDGLGNYRTRVRSSTFPEGTVENRVFTNYNSAFDYGDVNQPSQEQAIPGEMDKWLLRDFTFRETSQGADRSLAEYCFDPVTGVLLGERRLKDQDEDHATNPGFEEGPEDALTLFTFDSSGFPAETRFYGGDGADAPLANGDVCQTAAAEDYRVVQVHSKGVLEKSYFHDCNGNVVSRSVFDTIDPTGLLTRTEDEAGIATVFRYDQEGRLRCSSKVGEVETWHSYQFPSSVGDVAMLETLTCPAGPSSCDQGVCQASSYLTQERTFYDGLGRPTLTQRRMPLEGGDGWVERATTYDEVGRVSRQSAWVPEGEANLPSDPDTIPDSSHTAHSWQRGYDRFGRPAKVENPDRSFTTFSYTGNRQVTSTVTVGQGSVESQRTEIRDGHGRLAAVSEASGNGTTSVHTTYRYDQEGRLARVCFNDNDTSPQDCPQSGAQRRIFDYDGRGWLSEENHPELGTTANGKVSYTYDAMGKVILRDAPGTASDLTHVYDQAGRLTQVCTEGDANGSCSNPAARLRKEFFYGRENLGNDRRGGKLVTAKRHNWVRTADSPNNDTDIVVTENFAYTQRSGKLSEYGIRSAGGGNFRYRIQAYNDLGSITSLEYPECLHGSCDIGNGGTKVYTYDRGLLAQIAGTVSSVSYHPNGQPDELVHSNGTVDHRDLEDDWRLGSISLVDDAGTLLWNTGNYTYDAAGNILNMGSEEFDYDRVGRLTESTVQLPDGSAVIQDLAYDIYGNLTSMETTDHGVISLGPSAVSNRLSSAGYDPRGNMTSATIDGTGLTFAYDPFDRMKLSSESGGAASSFLYTASDERFAILNPGSEDETYTIRGPANEVLTRARRFSTAALTRHKDYIYAGAALVAVDGPTGQLHIHSDHLGTTRRVTDGSDPVLVVEATTLYPFGGYTDLPVADSEELLFTGHERDARSSNPDAALDYMHARYYAAHLGRFTSIDPVLGEASAPQSWNRYSYVRNSPMGFSDPTGMQGQNSQQAHVCSDSLDSSSCNGPEIMTNAELASEQLKLAGKGLLNLMEGVSQVSAFLNDQTFGRFMGIYSRPGPKPPEVLGGEAVQRFGNAIGIAAVLPALKPLVLQTGGGILGGAQALGGKGVAIGNLGFTSSAAQAGYGVLSVPGMLYSGPFGATQQSFQTVAGLRNIVTGAPIVLGPAGPITKLMEVPFLVRLGATITKSGGPP
ncbi:MAG: RHS repeat-associated core domain-containing protein [Deltaproteobacteria bacterium]|nr:RHS repeat-associated core domain-containing protein [Deltaproteobacteria bacterium]